MKNRTLQVPKRRLAILTFTLIIFVLQSGCIPSGPALGGIEVRTFETIEGIGNALFPVPGAPNAGNVLPRPDGSGWWFNGPGPGTQLSFAGGITDATGTSAYPNARTNARWQVTAGPTVQPPCFAGTGVEDVPSEGMTFKFVCVTLRF